MKMRCASHLLQVCMKENLIAPLVLALFDSLWPSLVLVLAALISLLTKNRWGLHSQFQQAEQSIILFASLAHYSTNTARVRLQHKHCKSKKQSCLMLSNLFAQNA